MVRHALIATVNGISTRDFFPLRKIGISIFFIADRNRTLETDAFFYLRDNFIFLAGYPLPGLSQTEAAATTGRPMRWSAALPEHGSGRRGPLSPRQLHH